MGERRGAYRALVEKPEEGRPLGRPRCKWEDNIKMDLGEVGWGQVLDRSGTGYGQIAGCCKCGNERSVFIECRERLD
jgi:hypothetical protein